MLQEVVKRFDRQKRGTGVARIQLLDDQTMQLKILWAKTQLCTCAIALGAGRWKYLKWVLFGHKILFCKLVWTQWQYSSMFAYYIAFCDKVYAKQLLKADILIFWGRGGVNSISILRMTMWLDWRLSDDLDLKSFKPTMFA